MILVRSHIYVARFKPLVMTTKELKKFAAREEWKNIITQGWIRTEED